MISAQQQSKLAEREYEFRVIAGNAARGCIGEEVRHRNSRRRRFKYAMSLDEDAGERSSFGFHAFDLSLENAILLLDIRDRQLGQQAATADDFQSFDPNNARLLFQARDLSGSECAELFREYLAVRLPQL